jgi:hypothetical protein
MERFPAWRSGLHVGAGLPLRDKVFIIRFDQHACRIGFFAEFWALSALIRPSASAARGDKDFCRGSS